MNLRQYLDEQIAHAMITCNLPADAHPMVRQSVRKEFGDYQANGIMPAAKLLKTNPRELALKVVENLNWKSFAEKVEVAGPGFINIHLKSEWLEEMAKNCLQHPSLAVSHSAKPLTVVIDYSSTNLAKEMHVGHLRSTIIGDVLARVYSFLGNNVIRQNHVGDWGTQFGMLLAHLEDVRKSNPSTNIDLELSDLESFYVAAKKRFDEDKVFEEKSRAKVVKFQSGDARSLEDLHAFIETSLKHCEEIFKRLNILLERKDVRGESAYNPDLPIIVEELKAQNLLVTDDGAQCVFLDEFKGKEGNPLPIIVQKSDGGFLYMTTDLAALSYRSHKLMANEILVVTDSRQALHFKQLEALGKKAGFLKPGCALHNVTFGMMLGQDGRPFKSRTGGTLKLSDLLNEAEERAYNLVKTKNIDFAENELRHIATVVGISAIKYADLSKHRNSDYVFSWEQMLSFDGNTAPYMLYAYTRIAGILRKAGTTIETIAPGKISISAPEERDLALLLVQFSEVLHSVVAEHLPHYLCTYLYSLASAFMSFYEACPVMNAAENERESRLRMAALTARTLKQGLDLLGIKTLEKM